MKKPFLRLSNFYLLTFLMISSCSDKKIDVSQLQIRQDTYYEMNETRPFNGEAIEQFEGVYNPKKKIQSQIKCQFQIKNGLKSGEFVLYSKNGQIEEEGSYKKGLKSGTFKYWNKDNGALRYEAEYEKDTLNGTKIKYHETGEIRSTTEFAKGNLHGDIKSFRKTGECSGISHWVNGSQQGAEQSFDINGLVRKEFNFKNNNLHGKFFEK